MNNAAVSRETMGANPNIVSTPYAANDVDQRNVVAVTVSTLKSGGLLSPTGKPSQAKHKPRNDHTP